MANGGNFGLGISLGEPTGISMKLWSSEKSAIDVGLAWSLGSNYTFHIHADYLLHSFNMFKVEKNRMALYYGIGGRIKIRDDDNPATSDDDRIGVRMPVGINYIFDNAPIDIFLEIVPVLDLAPDTDFDFNAAVGARYFF
jgi:hypothetical protein